MDFTLTKYTELLQALKNYGFESLILRHDVDLKPANSLRIAHIEADLGLLGIYYFRAVPQSWDESITRQIAGLGHEIGYHYEDMTICEGKAEKAITHFKNQLDYFRQFYPVKTICMHGAPTSKYDGKDLWKHYNYRDYGIIGEPYFDVDYSQVVYLTDTGRCWDGYKVSVRDKIEKYQDEWTKQGLVFHTTEQLINWLQDNSHERRNLLITTHPQRWTDNNAAWLKELTMQKAKNIVKRVLVATK